MPGRGVHGIHAAKYSGARQQANGHEYANDKPTLNQAARPRRVAQSRVVQSRQPQTNQGVAEHRVQASQEPARDADDNECRADGDYERADQCGD
jgi:hypothetical protein